MSACLNIEHAETYINKCIQSYLWMKYHMLLVDFLGERFMPRVYSSSLLLKTKTPACYGPKMCMPLLEIGTPTLSRR